MNTGLKDRVAIVAAASQGLGRATAEALAAEGARLAICSRSEKNIQAAAAMLRDKCKGDVFCQTLDVADEKGVKRFVEAVAQKYGRIDVCVTNAGGPPGRGFFATTTEEWRKAFDMNLMSTIHFVREVLPHMQRAHWGRIIAITSMAVKQPIPDLVYSNTLRTGLLGLMRSLANEFGSEGITFNNVAPGYTATDRLKDFAHHRAQQSGLETKDIIARWAKETTAGRLAQPAEIADAIVFLASERAAMITGQTVLVDGGTYKGL
jgi:3-oxoacyl-[acyl-carrier protein] reductase